MGSILKQKTSSNPISDWYLKKSKLYPIDNIYHIDIGKNLGQNQFWVDIGKHLGQMHYRVDIGKDPG